MAPRLQFTCLLAIPLALLAAQSAHGSTLLHVFGDSLSDQGGLSRAVYGSAPSPPYFEGEFTSAPGVWGDQIQNVSKGMVQVIDNFAMGGATACTYKNVTQPVQTTGFVGLPFSSIPSLVQQVQLYLSRGLKHQKSADLILAFTWIGHNDLAVQTEQLTHGQASIVSQDIVDCIAEASTALLSDPSINGIVVGTLSNIEDTPLVRANNQSDDLGLVISGINTGIAKVVDALRTQFNHSTVILWDAHTELKELYNNYKKEGFTDIVNACLTETGSDLSACANPDEYWWWGDLHPTSHVHNLIARSITAAIQAGSTPQHTALL